MNTIVLENRDLDRSGIYVIVDKTGVAKYVGQAKCFQDRWRSHIADLKRNRHVNFRLQAARSDHSKDLKFEILEFCIFCDLNKREQYWIDTLDPEYNIVRKIYPMPTWREIMKRDKDYVKEGESFRRPIWHLWVYGGHKKPR